MAIGEIRNHGKVSAGNNVNTEEENLSVPQVGASKEVNKEVGSHVITPPFNSSEVKAVNIPPISESVQEIIKLLGEIEKLAKEIYQEYPPQNLRQVRKLFNDLKINADKAPEGFDSLYAKKNEILALLDKVRAIAVEGLTENLQNQNKYMEQREEIIKLKEGLENIEKSNPKVHPMLVKVLYAKSLLEIIEYCAPQALHKITINPPDNVASYQIKVARPALAMFQTIDQSPKIKGEAESTSKAEADINQGGVIPWVISKLYTGKTSVPEQRPFQFYIEAYKIDQSIPLPGLKKIKEQVKAFEGKVTNPYRIWIADYSATTKEEGIAQLAPTYADRYVDLEQQAPIFQFLKTYEADYKKAAEVLSLSHPDISADTWTTFLMLNTFVEIFWMTNEDPWQDKSAASWYGTKEAEAFKKTYADLSGKGYVFGAKIKDKEGNEKVYDIPWRLASIKVPITSQGIGPNAVIIGDLLKAGEYDGGKLWKQYFPEVERTKENAVKIALDPAQSIKAIALVFDVKLRELNRTIFSDPEVKMPDDTYPAIRDHQKSREYFKLTWLRYCKAFPEVAVNFPDYFPYGHNSWNVDFIDSYFKIIETVMERPDSFPELKMGFIPSKDKTIADYFGDQKNPRNMDAVMMISLPVNNNPGSEEFSVVDWHQVPMMDKELIGAADRAYQGGIIGFGIIINAINMKGNKEIDFHLQYKPAIQHADGDNKVVLTLSGGKKISLAFKSSEEALSFCAKGVAENLMTEEQFSRLLEEVEAYKKRKGGQIK